MTGFYNEMADTAAALLAEFGREVTLRRVNPGAYSASSDSFSGGSSVDVPISAVVTEFKLREIDGEIIQRGDKKVLTTSRPLKDDILIDDDGTQYRILAVNEVRPGPTAILYKAQARK